MSDFNWDKYTNKESSFKWDDYTDPNEVADEKLPIEQPDNNVGYWSGRPPQKVDIQDVKDRGELLLQGLSGQQKPRIEAMLKDKYAKYLSPQLQVPYAITKYATDPDYREQYGQAKRESEQNISDIRDRVPGSMFYETIGSLPSQALAGASLPANLLLNAIESTGGEDLTTSEGITGSGLKAGISSALNLIPFLAGKGKKYVKGKMTPEVEPKVNKEWFEDYIGVQGKQGVGESVSNKQLKEINEIYQKGVSPYTNELKSAYDNVGKQMSKLNKDFYSARYSDEMEALMDSFMSNADEATVRSFEKSMKQITDEFKRKKMSAGQLYNAIDDFKTLKEKAFSDYGKLTSYQRNFLESANDFISKVKNDLIEQTGDVGQLLKDTDVKWAKLQEYEPFLNKITQKGVSLDKQYAGRSFPKAAAKDLTNRVYPSKRSLLAEIPENISMQGLEYKDPLFKSIQQGTANMEDILDFVSKNPDVKFNPETTPKGLWAFLDSIGVLDTPASYLAGRQIGNRFGE